jgi:putative heme-binding domain-containing protein
MTRVFLATLTLFLVPALTHAGPGFKVPDGFVVTEWADSSVANDIYCINFTPDGRLIVAARGYIRLIEGTENEKAGKAHDFAHPFADGAMGLLWDEGHLYATGGGGLRRFRDVDAGGIGKPSELLFACKTGGEHEAHAIVRNRDGWFYLLCGNSTGISAKTATLPTSPITDPMAGCLLRFPPDFKGCEIVCDGFRNAYGMDRNEDGELFTYDSDNERCVGLPWYEFTRAYHLVPGGRYGWMSPQKAETWRMPPHFVDVVPPLAHLERGSPTGVVCYKHAQFPKEYRGGLFLLDWTFGRIWFTPLTPDGSTYKPAPVRFLEVTGEDGFAPTAAAVHPKTGDLFVSIGGRGTRGAIYRIRYPKGLPVTLTQTARKEPAPPVLDWQTSGSEVWLEWARDSDRRVRRRALEYLTRFAEKFPTEKLLEAICANWAEPDRLLRQATARLILKLPAEARAKLTATEPLARITLSLVDPTRDSLIDLVTAERLPDAVRIDAVRCLQRWLGDIPGKAARGTAFEGYTLAGKGGTLTPEQRASLFRTFGGHPPEVDREVARSLALIGMDGSAVITRTLDAITATTLSPDDVHYLLVLAKLPASRGPGQTRRTAEALLALDAKQDKEKQAIDSNWPRRMAELHKELATRDPELNAALLAARDFGRPAHAVFTHAPGFDRVTAARKFLQHRKDPGFTWNAELIPLLGLLPASEALPVLRELWGEAGLNDVILPLLAREPVGEDRPRLIQALALGNPNIVQDAATALEKLGPSRDADETLALLRALRDVPPGKEFDSIRARINLTLQGQTKQKHATLADWSAWLREMDAPRWKLLEQGSIDRAAWNARLGKIDWTTGDADRGKTVYAKASCASCHSGSQALGPDLRGIAGRFSRDDLFTAILEPSKEVAARYRMTIFTTEAGKVYQGIVIYEATDSLLLQTGPATTVRIESPRIKDRRTSAQSLMPAGLLDKLTDTEIADLLAYLRALK